MMLSLRGIICLSNSKKTLPSIKDDKFIKKVKADIYEEDKYNTHKTLLSKITKSESFEMKFGAYGGLKPIAP